MKKRFLTTILVLSLVLGLCACGAENGQQTAQGNTVESDENTQSVSVEETKTDDVEETIAEPQETEPEESTEMSEEEIEIDEPQETKYYVDLLDVGDFKIEAIKIYREHTGVGLKEAKDAVDSAPCTILKTTDLEAAEALADALEEIGVTVTVTEVSEETEIYVEKLDAISGIDQMAESDRIYFSELLLGYWKKLDYDTLKKFDAETGEETKIDLFASAASQDKDIETVWKQTMETVSYYPGTDFLVYKDLTYIAQKYYTECYLTSGQFPYTDLKEIPKEEALKVYNKYFDAAPYRMSEQGLNLVCETVDGKLRVKLAEFITDIGYGSMHELCSEGTVLWGNLTMGSSMEPDTDYAYLKTTFGQPEVFVGGDIKAIRDYYLENVDKGSESYQNYEQWASYLEEESTCALIQEYFAENCEILLDSQGLYFYVALDETEKVVYNNAVSVKEGNHAPDTDVKNVMIIKDMNGVDTIFETIILNLQEAEILE